MGAKFNKPGSNAPFYNVADLLIYGYIRDIYKSFADATPTDIYIICKAYYVTSKYIFMYDHSAFHILNATSPTSPMLHKNVIKSNDKSTSWNRPFDLSCYIPNILNISPNILSMVANEESKNESSTGIYDGIFCRAHSKTHESGESSRSLYIFPNKRITRNKRSKKYAYHLLQSATGNRGKLLQHMLYCGDKYGIIGTGGALVPVVYQLKLENISDKKFIFNEISDEKNSEEIWGRHPGYQCKQYLMLQYLSGREQLFAVQCKQEHGASVGKKKPPEKKIIGAKCGLYDLPTNKWLKVNNFRASTYLNDDEDNFKCGLAYNAQKNEIFLVSSLGRTAKYDFHTNCWKVLYENVENFNDMSMRYDMGPIVWTYEYQPHLLYCIGGKYNKSKNTKYVLQYKQFDIRSDKRQWLDCINKQNIKQFKDLDFQSMFV